MEKILNFIIKASISSAVFSVPLAWSPWTFDAFEFPKQYLLFFFVLLGLFAWVAKMVLVERELHFKKNPLNLFGLQRVVTINGQLNQYFVVDERYDAVAGHRELPERQLGTVGSQTLKRCIPTLRKADSTPEPTSQRGHWGPE